MINTLSDTDLEREYITSKFLGELILPKSYIQLRLLISSVEILDTSEIFPLPYSYIVSEITDKSGLLDDSCLEDYYFGKELGLMKAFILLHEKVTILIPLFEKLITDTFVNSINKIAPNISKEGFDGQAYLLKQALVDEESNKNHQEVSTGLQILKGKLEEILLLFGSGDKKLSHKIITSKFDTDYKIYLNDLYSNIDKFIFEPELAVTVGKTINSIESLDPKESLDPYKVELENNLISQLIHPKDFYKNIESGKIIGSDIGMLFYTCYPHFYKKFYSIFLDEYESLSYQKQIQFKQGFGIPSDDSVISQLCASAAIVQPQGV